MHSTDVVPLALVLPAGALFLFLLARAILLRRALGSVSIRIHVGGTRGKTTVCRLIAAGLRSDGVRTLAKTTGTEPMLILPDGSERRWLRAGPPTIGEQRRFAVLAARLKVQATVLECMAIRADLVGACECDLVRATVAVITNIRPDHLEDLRSTEAIAESHLGLVPKNGVLVVAADALSPPLRERAARQGTRIVAVPTAGLPASEANRAIALAACVAAGCMPAQLPASITDAGGVAVAAIEVNGKRFHFGDAFACNDAVSLDLQWRVQAAGDRASVALLNHRNDRPLRSLQFLDYFASLPLRPRVLLLGSTFWLRRAARRRGLDVRAIAGMQWSAGRVLLERIATEVPDGSLVWGVGNYHGRGAAVARALREEMRREAPCSP